MKRIVLLTIISTLATLGYFLLASNVHLTTTYQSTSYTKVIILLPGKVSIPDDDLFKTITDPVQLSRIAKFVHEQLDSKEGWRPEWDGVSIAPHHFIQLAFYQEDTNELNFGIGGTFISTFDSTNGYRVKRVSKKTWKEFLDLIGMTEEEYNRLHHDWLATPGRPWKKK